MKIYNIKFLVLKISQITVLYFFLFSIKSEPQKFIFPPPSSLTNNRSTLSLPLSSTRSDANIHSPLISTPFPSSLSSSSPLRAPPPSQSGRAFPRHYSIAQTPAESPFDPITPTPLSHGSRLMPLLPEAHALYISLALLDSALAANVSDNVAIDFSAFQNFMLNKRNSWRNQLDSVGSVSTPLAVNEGEGGGGGIFKLEDEKPLMMVGIADYPSLGFKEDVIVTTPAPSSGGWQGSSTFLPFMPDSEGTCMYLYMCVSKCFLVSTYIQKYI